MKRKWMLPFLAAFGMLFGIFMVMATTKPAPKPKMIAEPAKAPFPAYVSGAGLIEASTENVKVGATTGGLVTQVFVKVGDKVAKGHPLFQIDDGPKRAELARYQAALQSAEATLTSCIWQSSGGNRQAAGAGEPGSGAVGRCAAAVEAAGGGQRRRMPAP